MDLLLSIKPQFADKILSGYKHFEYRKKIFKKQINDIYICSSFPGRKVVGKFKYSGYLDGTPEEIWEETHNHSGMAHVGFQGLIHVGSGLRYLHYHWGVSSAYPSVDNANNTSLTPSTSRTFGHHVQKIQKPNMSLWNFIKIFFQLLCREKIYFMQKDIS